MNSNDTESTGRLRRALKPELRRLVYPPFSPEEMLDECRLYASIERAHLTTLICRGLTSDKLALRLFERLKELENDGFTRVFVADKPRGFYLAWENALTFDEDARGFTHLARSRNDINATVARLKTRKAVSNIFCSGIKLLESLIVAATKFSDVASCGITHYRPAAPSTVGFQSLAWTFATIRELEAMISSLEEIDARCPMGACAQMGTTVPICPYVTAKLLGFEQAFENSLDAVADRSYCLRALANAANLGVCESRICQDLAFQAGPLELIRFDDDLSGGSSNMPQKRNPFLLELIPAKASVALGALTTFATTLRGTMFTNTASAGEAASDAYRAFQATTNATTLLEAVIRNMSPRSDKTRELAEKGFVVAASIAEKIAQNSSSLSFRNAHRKTGEWVNFAEATGTPFAEIVERESAQLGTPISADSCSLDATLKALKYGGGPGKESFTTQLEIATKKLADLLEIKTRFERRWQNADDALTALSQIKTTPLKTAFVQFLLDRFNIEL